MLASIKAIEAQKELLARVQVLVALTTEAIEHAIEIGVEAPELGKAGIHIAEAAKSIASGVGAMERLH